MFVSESRDEEQTTSAIFLGLFVCLFVWVVFVYFVCCGFVVGWGKWESETKNNNNNNATTTTSTTTTTKWVQFGRMKLGHWEGAICRLWISILRLISIRLISNPRLDRLVI